MMVLFSGHFLVFTKDHGLELVLTFSWALIYTVSSTNSLLVGHNPWSWCKLALRSVKTTRRRKKEKHGSCAKRPCRGNILNKRVVRNISKCENDTAAVIIM